MHRVFPQFKPFAQNGIVGFRGYLEGPRTRRIYEVLVQARNHQYPEVEPAIYMDRRAEPEHWINDGRLCYLREERVWSPGRGTFANTLTIAIKYLAKFD
jgi:hypothetical protein